MSVNVVNPTTGEVTPIAGRGSAEYGASAVRKKTVVIPSTAANRYTITFDTPMPDADYIISWQITGCLDADKDKIVGEVSKSASGFDLWVFAPLSSDVTITYTAFKLYTDLEYDHILDIIPSTATVNNKLLAKDGVEYVRTQAWSLANGNMQIFLATKNTVASVIYANLNCTNCTGTPYSGTGSYNFYVIVINSGSGTRQNVIATNCYNNDTFISYNTDGTWSAWEKLVTDKVITGAPTSVHSGVDNVVLKKQGKMVTLTVSYDATSMPTDWVTIMNIPEGFRPAYSVSIPVGNAFGYSSVANMYGTGDLNVYKHSASQGPYCYLNATWTTE